MFCHLYELSIRTDIPLHKFIECSDECQYSISEKCKIVEELKENLTPNKYNWQLLKKIVFDIPIHSHAGNTAYIAAIVLIHPNHNDIYILHNLKHDKKDDKWNNSYKMYFGTDVKDFDDLKGLNIFLKSNGYTGRNLRSVDFKKKGE